MISTDFRAYPSSAPQLVLAAGPFTCFSESVQEKMLKVIALIQDCWTSFVQLIYCGRQKIVRNSLLEEGKKCIHNQINPDSLFGLNYPAIRVATLAFFKGKVVGLECSAIDKSCEASFASHVKRAHKMLECSEVGSKFEASSPLTITTFFIEETAAGKTRGMRFISAELKNPSTSTYADPAITYVNVSAETLADVSTEMGSLLIDEIVNHVSDDYRARIKHYFFDKV